MTTPTLHVEHLALMFSRLNERQRRWVAGALAELLGHGGIKQIAEIAGLDPKTVRQGRIDLARNLEDFPDDDRVRRPGGGRPPIEKKYPTSGNNSNGSSIRKPAATRKDMRSTRGAACGTSPND